MKMYILERDILVPAGTYIDPAPTKTERFVPFGSIMLENGPDSTIEVTFDLEEASETGLISEITV